MITPVKIRNIVSTIMIILVSALSSSAYASDAIDTTIKVDTKRSYSLYLPKISGFIETEHKGIGAIINKEIVKRIEEKHSVDIEITALPVKRAIAHFNKKKADLIFAMVLGDTDQNLMNTQSSLTIDSAATAGSSYAIYTLNSQPKLSSLEHIENRSVGVIDGTTLPPEFSKYSNISLHYSHSLELQFKQLRMGRLDAILTVKALGDSEIKKLGIKDIHHGDDFGFLFACYSAQLTEEGARLIEYINIAIASMIKDGTYSEITRDYPGSLLQM